MKLPETTQTRPEAEMASGKTFTPHPRTFSESVIMTLKLLMIFGAFFGMLWGVDTLVSSK